MFKCVCLHVQHLSTFHFSCYLVVLCCFLSACVACCQLDFSVTGIDTKMLNVCLCFLFRFPPCCCSSWTCVIGRSVKCKLYVTALGLLRLRAENVMRLLTVNCQLAVRKFSKEWHSNSFASRFYIYLFVCMLGIANVAFETSWLPKHACLPNYIVYLSTLLFVCIYVRMYVPYSHCLLLNSFVDDLCDIHLRRRILKFAPFHHLSFRLSVSTFGFISKLFVNIQVYF